MKPTNIHKVAIFVILLVLLSFLAFRYREIVGRFQAAKHFRLGYRYLTEGKAAPAIAEFDKTLAVDHDNPDAYLRIGELCYRSKLWRASAKYFEKIVGWEPRSRLRLILADCYDKISDLVSAEAHYKAYINLYPEDPFGYNNLGYFYAEHNRKLDESIRLIRKALKKAPESGMIIDSLGWAYYKKGWLQGSREELERAAKLEPKEPEIIYHLGIVYRDMGMKEEAIKQFRKALKIAPEFKKAKNELRKIEQSKN